MSINDMLLPEFDQEMANTRKSLERVPEDKFDWKPHAKSMSLAQLASHLAEIAGWGKETMTLTELDLAPPGAPPNQPWLASTRAELLEKFDHNMAAARAAIASSPDEAYMVPWSLLMGGNTMMTMPRIAVLRGFVLSHTIHHRAQLGVYLRLLDVPVPSIYGPSADEGRMG